VCWFGL